MWHQRLPIGSVSATCGQKYHFPPPMSPDPDWDRGLEAAISFMGAWILDTDVLSRMGRAVLACWDLIDVSSIFYSNCGLGEGIFIYL